MDTANEFLVAVSAEDILIMNPPRARISKERAAVLAAWIVALTGREAFEKALDAVENT